MNESQKVWEPADTIEAIIDRKYKRYAQTIAQRLEEDFSPLSLCSGRQPTTRWEEFKSQLRQKPSYARDVSKQFVKKCCSELLKELPADERSVLWLLDALDKGKRDALLLELYDKVHDLAVNEAEREAWFATTPSESKLPVSRRSDEIVIPLADFLVRTGLLEDFRKDVHRRFLYDRLPGDEDPDPEDLEKAVRQLLENNPLLLFQEELEEVLKLPRNERGEYLYERICENLSTGERDN